ncbi:MAG: amidohydrolase family protein [Pseudomonadota bacterium]
MKRIVLYTSALLLSFSASGLPPEPAPAQTRATALVGATLHVGDGTVLTDATLTFDQGLITAVGARDQVPTANHDVIDVSGQRVYPGFILPDSNLGLTEVGSIPDTVDTRETGNLNPNVRALVAYNTDSELIPTLRFNGILTAQVSPLGGTVAGLSSVVQLDAWNFEDAAVVVDDGLFVNWPAQKRGQFDFSTFTLKRVKNEAYAEQIGELTTLFEDARAALESNPQDPNLKLAAAARVLRGQSHLYVNTNISQDMVLAVKFARRFAIPNVVILGRDGLLRAAPYLAEENVPVIVLGTHWNPPFDRSDIDLPFRLPALLLEQGVKVGLTYPGDPMNTRNLAFAAGTAAAHGLDREAALRMITLTNAEILGLDDQLGSLTPGKRATLFVSRGDALDMRGNQLTAAYIDGRRLQLDGRQQELYQRYRRRYSQTEPAR